MLVNKSPGRNSVNCNFNVSRKVPGLDEDKREESMGRDNSPEPPQCRIVSFIISNSSSSCSIFDANVKSKATNWTINCRDSQLHNIERRLGCYCKINQRNGKLAHLMKTDDNNNNRQLLKHTQYEVISSSSSNSHPGTICHLLIGQCNKRPVLMMIGGEREEIDGRKEAKKFAGWNGILSYLVSEAIRLLRR